jgi:predicted DNA-binding protein (UPF0251 family)
MDIKVKTETITNTTVTLEMNEKQALWLKDFSQIPSTDETLEAGQYRSQLFNALYAALSK